MKINSETFSHDQCIDALAQLDWSDNAEAFFQDEETLQAFLQDFDKIPEKYQKSFIKKMKEGLILVGENMELAALQSLCTEHFDDVQ